LGIAGALQGSFDLQVLAPNDRPGETTKTRFAYHVVGSRNPFARYYSRALAGEIRRRVRADRPRFVIASLYMSGLTVARALRSTSVPLVLDHHNVEHQRFRTMGRPLVARAMRRYERWLFRRSSLIVVVSEDDRQGLRAMGVQDGKLVVVPNGFDPKQFRFDPARGAQVRTELGLTPTDKAVLFFGKLDYAPNRDAVLKILDVARAFADRPEIRFLIAGANLGPMSLPDNVTYLGAVKSTADLLQAADLVLAPLSSGGGTKLKVIEALATGRTVLTSPVGVEGLGADIAAVCHICTNGDWESGLRALLPSSRFGASPSVAQERAVRPFEWDVVVQPLVHRLAGFPAS
ncbi:MAG: polysaccharide biosynthesis protein PslH, partial [Thermoplasmata archaeon]|jgi:glycosyltransferase involved in cell wall biosynthesis|nr:polysaccharide biosynthesis protein PslH [Thermoplasmata archaeon]